jgi:hypothetical protein
MGAGRGGCVAFVLIACAGVMFSQTDTTMNGGKSVPHFDPRPSIPRAVSFLSPLILPKLAADVTALKEYVVSGEFAAFRRTYGDLCSVDALFDRAMRLSWNNAFEALFITTLATMEHRRFGIRIPLLGPLLWFPLTGEFEDEFHARVRALPSRLYPDTLRGEGNDVDKLQHFFGSAFLTYLFESRETADRIGDFIEWGEDLFIVDGLMDVRDVRANRQGQEFGMQLLNDDTVLPSGYFRIGVMPRPDTHVDQPIPAPIPDSLVPSLEAK